MLGEITNFECLQIRTYLARLSVEERTTETDSYMYKKHDDIKRGLRRLRAHIYMVGRNIT